MGLQHIYGRAYFCFGYRRLGYRSSAAEISLIPREAYTRVKRVNNECLMNAPSSSSSLNSSTYNNNNRGQARSIRLTWPLTSVCLMSTVWGRLFQVEHSSGLRPCPRRPLDPQTSCFGHPPTSISANVHIRIFSICPTRAPRFRRALPVTQAGQGAISRPARAPECGTPGPGRLAPAGGVWLMALP